MNVSCCDRSFVICDHLLVPIFTHETSEGIVYVSHSGWIGALHFLLDVLRQYLFFLDSFE